MLRYQIVTFQDFFYLSSAVELALLAIRERPESDDHETNRYAACVIGSTTCSVSFLECTINGLYTDAASHERPTKFHKSLASVWGEAFDRLPILAKYQLALTLAGRDTFRTDREPYQSAAALIELRNAIAHPKEIMGSNKNQQRLERHLRGRYKFGPQEEHRSEFFPGRCLTADCAVWSARVAGKFAVDFKRRLPPTAYFFGGRETEVHEILSKLDGSKPKS